ncbi:Eukaryotic translation initiation factor 5B [Chlorella vulgaris]
MAARERREAKLEQALAARDPKDLRSPICCILGHVDTGKTKILDNIRRTNVQDGEAGGITQQIGATYIPASAVETRTEELRKGRQFDLKLPGLLVIDTPGHESFSNLRSRGSGLCDIAILVIDLMHGLEQQTIESINLLKMRKTPFIIAMNKVDRLYKWQTVANSPIQDAMARQEEYVRKEFEDRYNQVALQLNEQGLNVALYWKNRDPRSFISIVPTSAITGEGIPDLLQLVVKLTQSLMAERLMFVNNLESTVLEVKQIEGLGTTIDVVLVNGMLREGDTIVVCGLGGPIVTTIRALLTPQPMREIRVKGQYVHHKELRAAMGVKIAAHNLESAVAGTQLYVVGPDDDVEDLKDAVMEDMQDIFSSVDKTGEGVCVQASTLGSLEALLEFLRSDAVQIAVSSINIGPINKKDIMRANAMIERGHRKFGVILAFDVPVTREAASLAEQMGVRIFTADIIYHLFDQFTAYLKTVKEEEQEAAKLTAVFPCVLKILPTCIFNQKDPIILGVEVMEGIAKVGTPICVPSRQGGVDLGRIASLEKEHKSVDIAKKGDTVAMKIESTKPEEASRSYERHFDHTDELVSRITRKSINVLKDMFRDELSKDDWRLVIKLKKVFKID